MNDQKVNGNTPTPPNRERPATPSSERPERKERAGDSIQGAPHGYNPRRFEGVLSLVISMLDAHPPAKNEDEVDILSEEHRQKLIDYYNDEDRYKKLSREIRAIYFRELGATDASIEDVLEEREKLTDPIQASTFESILVADNLFTAIGHAAFSVVHPGPTADMVATLLAASVSYRITNTRDQVASSRGGGGGLGALIEAALAREGGAR